MPSCACELPLPCAHARCAPEQARHDASVGLTEVLAKWRQHGLVDLNESSHRVSFPAASWAPLPSAQPASLL